MKPSDLEQEINHFKQNPKRYFYLLSGVFIVGILGFYFAKYVSGETSTECENPVYVFAETPACGVLEYNASAGSQCGVNEYKRCRTGGCGWQKLGGVVDIGKGRANTCRHHNCGVESYKTCQHADFGVASYKTCRDASHGIEKCEDPPPWQFWR